MPRPSILTRAVADRIVRLLLAGVPSETAAEASGVSATQFFVWLRLGREDAGEDEPRVPHGGELSFAEFAEGVTRARSEAQVRAVASITAAAQRGEWAAAAWWLERANPRRWGRRSKVTSVHVGDPDNPVVIVDQTQSRMELLRRIAQVLERRRSS